MPRWLPVVVLATLPLLAHWPVLSGWLDADGVYLGGALATSWRAGPLPGNPSLDPNTAWTTQALGRLVAEEWLRGRVPWWNPYAGIGMPLAAEIQPAALFLPFVLLLRFASGPVLLEIAMQITAGFATWGLLRALGLGRLAALTGAVLYAFNGTFAWHGHGPIRPVPFLPLFLLGIERARIAVERRRRGGWSWIPVAVALSLHAGFPETAYIDGLLALTWALYRLTALPGVSGRLAFCGKVTGGGALGLLLSAPTVLPFLQLMRMASVGDVARDFGGVAMQAPGLAALVFPYLFGPPTGLSYLEPTGVLGGQDALYGGYLGIALLFLSLLALAGGGRERGLRWVLAGWIVLCLGRTGGVPGITPLVNAIPMIRETMFFRYAPPSWELAAVVLAALALDDWRRGLWHGRRRLALALTVTVAIGGLSLLAAWPMIPPLLRAARIYPWVLAVSTLWTCTVLGATAWLLSRPPAPRRALLLGGLLMLDGIALFSVPLFTALRGATLDTPAIRFLQQNLGLQRFYTLGPFRPNFGAYFRVASINHTALPLPQVWVDHVQRQLDPSASANMFHGNFPDPAPGRPSHADELRRRLTAYAALGVRYVLAPAGQNPFVPMAAIRVSAAGSITPHPLTASQSLEGAVPGRAVQAGRIRRFDVMIGNYSGTADGALAVTLCTALSCAAGSAPLTGSRDNTEISVLLDNPLDVGAGEALRYRIAHVGGHRPVAVWLWPDQDRPADRTPKIVLFYETQGRLPPRVYGDTLLDIYEVPDAAPYFEARGGPCELHVQGREAVTARCARPATLVRRELFFPGWQASIDGTRTDIAREGDLFQAVRLPAGRSRVRFAYRPPHIDWAWACLAAGLLGLLAGTGIVRARPGARSS